MMQCRHRLGWLLVLGLFWLGDPARAACVKSVRTPDTEPYGIQDATGGLHGLHVDLIREALRRMQCEARFVDMPWARALIELQAGRLDLLPGAADTKERRVFALFSRPTNSARSVVFFRRDGRRKYRINKLADIIGTDLRLAVRRGAVYSDEYAALLKQTAFAERLSFVPSAKSSMLMMSAGRVDAMVTDELTGLRMIEQLGLQHTIQRSDWAISNDADLVAISKATNDPAFVQQFNAALGSMMTDGTYKRVLERYMACPVSLKRLGCR